VQSQLSVVGSQGNGEEVRAAGINPIDDMIAAHLVDRPEARIKRTYTTQAAPRRVECPGGMRGDPRRAAKQENLQLACAVGPLQRLEDVGSADAMLDRYADQTCDPDDRHAVGRTKVAVQHRLSELWI